MDAFYASVEQRDDPALKGKPVAVGGSSGRGVVAAASYEAREFGVRSAMPSSVASRRCPDLIFVPPRFDVYKEVSNEVMDIFREYTELIEPLSLDEAYLDVTHNKPELDSAILVARQIKKKILDRTMLTASAGISINKFLAKVASDINKPDGLTLISPENAQKFIDQLPIEKFHGIGKVTAEKLHKLNIYTGHDLRQWDEKTARRYLGKAGKFFLDIANCHDDRAVNPHRIRKSVGAENTFEKDLTDPDKIAEELERIAETVMKRMNKSGSYGKTLTLKVRFADFTTITRSKTVPYLLSNLNQILETRDQLLNELDLTNEKIRLLGLTVSNLDHQDQGDQLSLNL